MNALLAGALVMAALALPVRLAGRQHRLLHLLQLEHYENPRLLLWLRRRGELFSPRELAALAALLVAAVVARATGLPWLAAALLLGGAPPLALLGVREWRAEAIKPLIFTARAKRLLALALAPAVLLALAAVAVALAGTPTAALAAVAALAWLLLALAPWTLVAANRALAPLQRSIDERYVRAARARLREVAPTVVGITGSYGKTTTKFCTGAVLGADRRTLVTPESYNSLLGVVRTINERLRPEHSAFVVEMGMFRRGDIAELCDLVHPSIGVITAIGPMHLERLGSIEAIAKAKSELLDALPSDGHFVTNAQDPRCLELAARAHVPVTLFGIEAPPPSAGSGYSRAPQAPPSSISTSSAPVLARESAPPAAPQPQVIARDLRLEAGRSVFELLLDGPGSEPIEVSAALLGRHNVANLLAAAAVGRALGLDAATIAAGLATVQAPAHRLQPIHNAAAGVTVIDDAYNSNPEGAAAALEVLRAHPARRRLLVTPGMVELGELEPQLNRAFGEQAAAACDIAILVGAARTAPIREGLEAAGMDGTAVHVVRDIGEATELLARTTRAGDVVLFENDLPDTYAA